MADIDKQGVLRVGNGFVALYRSLLEHPLWQQLPVEWLKAWLYLLLRANHTASKWWDGSKEINIPPGSFVTSIQKIASGTKITTRQARGALAYFETAEMVTRETSNRHSVISISNWATYQVSFSRHGKLDDKLTTSTASARRQANDTPDGKPDGKLAGSSKAGLINGIAPIAVESAASQTANGKLARRQANDTHSGNSTTSKQLTRTDNSSSSDDEGASLLNGIPFDTLDEPPSGPSWEDELARVAKCIHERHPKHRGCSLKVVTAKLRTICNEVSASERLACLHHIDEQHAKWCLSGDWTEENGKYVKDLEGWLNPSKRKWDNEPLKPRGNTTAKNGNSAPPRAAYHREWRPPEAPGV